MTTTTINLDTSTTIPATHPIGADELQELMAADPAVRILDVRTGAEFETSHIPGSYNVPLATLGEHVRDLADVQHPVVLVCRSGARASQAHDQLQRAGKQSLRILEGGMVAWEATDGAVNRGETTRWAMDRQVRFTAGSIALAGMAASIVVPGAKWIAGGVAAGLTFSAVTDTCAMAAVLSKLPYNQTENCDISAVLAELNGEAR